MGWELQDVEKPFIAQLQGLGWTHVEGSIDDPAVTGRGSFAEVVQEAVLRERLRAINLRDGAPWLDDERLAEAVAAITRLPRRTCRRITRPSCAACWRWPVPAPRRSRPSCCA